MKKNGFTLIELLAVIIILGVLMIIAIPAVTKYIDESRKNGYVSTAKSIAGGARNLIYSGELDLSDTDTTYYIEGKCIKTDNAYKSPYGEFGEKSAYVVVTSTNDNYDYYWVSVDNTGTGVESIKKVDELEIEDIVSGIDTGEIDTNIGIDKRKNIVVVEGDNCTKSAPKLATRKMNSTTGQIKNACPSVTETIYWALQDPDSENHYQKFVLSDSPVSGGANGSFSGNTASYYSSPWLNYSSGYVSSVEILGTVAPASTQYLFYGLGRDLSSVNYDLRNLEVCNVTNMYGMFEYAGEDAENFNLNLTGWDTSNVTDMGYMFDHVGAPATEWSIEGLNTWDTLKVTNMEGMFYNAGRFTENFSLDISGWDTSNVTNMSHMFEQTGMASSSWSITGLNNLNTSNVTNMGDMFSYAGHNATTYSLNISSWNTGNVTNMGGMFSRAFEYVPEVNLNLSNWDTRNVTDMHYMFEYFGYNSQSFHLNISSFDMSNVSSIDNMFYANGQGAPSFEIIIPATNNNGLFNTTTNLYGQDSTISIDPPYGGWQYGNREFTLLPK